MILIILWPALLFLTGRSYDSFVAVAGYTQLNQAHCCCEFHSEILNVLNFPPLYGKLHLLCNKYGKLYITPTLSFPSVVQSQHTSPAFKAHLLAVQPDCQSWCMYLLFHTAGIASVLLEIIEHTKSNFTCISNQCKNAHDIPPLQIHILSSLSVNTVKGRTHMCFSVTVYSIQFNGEIKSSNLTELLWFNYLEI